MDKETAKIIDNWLALIRSKKDSEDKLVQQGKILTWLEGYVRGVLDTKE